MPIADAAGYFDAATPGYLVEIKRLIAIESTQMHRIFARGGQRFEIALDSRNGRVSDVRRIRR